MARVTGSNAPTRSKCSSSAARSYVCPQGVVTGSLKTSIVSGHVNAPGTSPRASAAAAREKTRSSAAQSTRGAPAPLLPVLLLLAAPLLLLAPAAKGGGSAPAAAASARSWPRSAATS